MIRPLVKIHGGKWFLKDWVISKFPSDYDTLRYIEPFVGGGSVFLNKKKSPVEIINDIDRNLMLIWNAVQWRCREFQLEMGQTPYCEASFNVAKSTIDFGGDFHRACVSYVVRRMSRGGLQKTFAWSDRQRGGQPGDVNAWKTAIHQLSLISERLRPLVELNNRPAIEILNKYNDNKSFSYQDPTYLHETRVSKKAYEFEMSEKDHVELAEVNNNFKGKVLISGYHSKLYAQLYKGWNVAEKKIANHASQKKTKQVKTEVLWKNY